MAEAPSSIKADLLLRLHGSEDEPTLVGTIEIPIRIVAADDTRIQCSPDFTVFEGAGKDIAAALKAELEEFTHRA